MEAGGIAQGPGDPGDFPARVDPNPQLLAEWEDRDLVRQRWIIDVQPYLSATMLVNLPKGLVRRRSAPRSSAAMGTALWQGTCHGQSDDPALRQEIADHGYNYGEVMAQKGFITYAIDWIGFGGNNDSQKPNHLNVAGNRDWCNLYYLHATMFGMTSLSINVAHGKVATDVISTFPNVDSGRLGVMGLSGGGTMALWMTLCDERVKASEIICYSDLWWAFGMRDINYCGMQVAPGLYKLVDLPELQGLIAPRPLLITIGANDTCFKVDTAMQCYQQLATIYQAAEASHRLELDLHPGEHGWAGNKSEAFFGRYLEA